MDFPKVVYVTCVTDADGSTFYVNEEPDAAGEDDDDRVAVYELRTVKRLSIKRTLEDV